MLPKPIHYDYSANKYLRELNPWRRERIKRYFAGKCGKVAFDDIVFISLAEVKTVEATLDAEGKL